MPHIQFTLQDGSVIQHELTEDLVTLGRVSENTIELADASVSSRHAQLARSGSDYAFRDLGSTNGSQYNGAPAAPGEDFVLQNGDMVTLGSVVAEYTADEGEKTLPSSTTASAVAASSSSRPANFANASPFQTKKAKRDPLGTGMVCLSLVAILAAGFALFKAFSMQAPL